jgi:predicted AAA+ superfamily ATPase
MDHLFPRHLLPVAQEMLEQFPAVSIEGARQVGKSTLAGMLAPGAAVANLDDDVTRSTARHDPGLLLAQGGAGVLIVDECQRVPELTLALKAAIDRDRRPGRFVVTGSASLLRVAGLADSLAGRVARLTLYGLSRGESAGLADDFVTAVQARDPRSWAEFSTATVRSDYADMIGEGSFPALRRLTERGRRTWFDSYLDSVLFRDLSELRREYDPNRGLAVTRVLAGNPSGELVAANVARATGIPASTVTGYLDLLRSAGLLATIPPWTPNLSKRESGRPKAFLLDGGLALRCVRLTAAQLVAVENLESFGRYLEALVAAELLKQRTWSAADFEVFHYRDRDGAEVDLVVELAGSGVIGLEVKASTAFRGDDFNGLRRLRDRLGPRFLAGFVLATAQTGFHYADRLYGLPIAALWEASSGGPH